MKVAIFTGAALPPQRTIGQMVAQSDGHSVKRHTNWRSK
jgi:hypothetical protein